MHEPRFDVGKPTPLLVDLGKMERGGLNAAFFVIWVPQHKLDKAGYAKAVKQAEQKYDAIGDMLMKYPDRIRLATTPAQAMANHKAGLLSAMIGIENSYSLGHDIHRLDAAYDRGARYVGLVHVGNNDLCTSSLPDTEHGEPAMNSAGDNGMSDFGRAGGQARQPARHDGRYLACLGRLRARCAEGLQRAAARLAFRRARRARPPAQPARRPAARDRGEGRRDPGGGVQGVPEEGPGSRSGREEAADRRWRSSSARRSTTATATTTARRWPPAWREIQKKYPLATLDDYMDQIQHMVKVAGIDHVGIASDFDGGGGITGWKDASETRNVTAALRKRGFSDADIAKIWGGNLLRVWGEVGRDAESSLIAPPSACRGGVSRSCLARVGTGRHAQQRREPPTSTASSTPWSPAITCPASPSA